MQNNKMRNDGAGKTAVPEFFPSQKYLIIIFSLFLAADFYFLFNSRWSFLPVDTQITFFPPSPVIAYNIKQLFHLKGIYAHALWGWIVFISISACFYAAGKFILEHISNYKKEGIILGNEISRAEYFSCSWLLGSWFCAMVWLLLGSMGLFRRGIAFLFIVAGLSLLCALLYKSFSKERLHSLAASFHFDARGLSIMILSLWVLSWSFLFVYPQHYWDTLMINMALPSYYVAESKFIPNPFHIYSYFAQNGELLSVWTLLGNSKEASYLLIWGFFSSLLIFIYGWISRVGSKTAAICILFLFTSSYLAPWLASYIKNDLQLGIFLILSWWALILSFEKYLKGNDSFKKWLFLSGLAAGIACGYKFTAVPIVLITLSGSFLFFLLSGNGSLREKFFKGVKLQMIFILGLSISWGPWLIRNFLITGNPIYPFMNSVLGTQPLFPWHTISIREYNLLSMGIPGLWEYLRNLTQFKPAGTFGKTLIWWGPGAWLCFSGLLCMAKPFPPAIRWVSGIAIFSWFVSLIFSMKPPHHAAPLIFIFCLSAGTVLSFIFQKTKLRFLKIGIILFVALDFTRSFSVMNIKNNILFCSAILTSGLPAWHQTTGISTMTPEFAKVEEIEWVNYTLDKYAPNREKVLFMGSVRPGIMKHPHYAAFNLGKQPILFFAEQSGNAEDLRNKLLSMGVHHIILDLESWNRWLKNDTVDGAHNISISPLDVEKINTFMKNDLDLRFSVPSGKLKWYTIRNVPGVHAKPVEFDADDVYQFPYNFIMLADHARVGHENEKALKILKLFDERPYIPDIMSGVRNLSNLLTEKAE